MSQFHDEAIIDVERRTKEVGKILGDPTLFPIDFLQWLKRYIEQSGITLPASSIIGGFKAGSGSVRNLAPGLILPIGGAAAPSGSLLCDGTSYIRATYPLLFAEIGTAYGAVDGTHFNVPDLRGRFPVGLGTHVDVDALGENDGVAVASRRPKHSHTQALTTNSTGSHDHGGSTGGAGGHGHTAFGTVVAGGGWGGGTGFTTTDSATSSVGDHSHGISSGGSHSHTISGTIGVAGMTDTPAYLVVNYVITTGQ